MCVCVLNKADSSVVWHMLSVLMCSMAELSAAFNTRMQGLCDFVLTGLVSTNPHLDCTVCVCVCSR